MNTSTYQQLLNGLLAQLSNCVTKDKQIDDFVCRPTTLPTLSNFLVDLRHEHPIMGNVPLIKRIKLIDVYEQISSAPNLIQSYILKLHSHDIKLPKFSSIIVDESFKIDNFPVDETVCERLIVNSSKWNSSLFSTIYRSQIKVYETLILESTHYNIYDKMFCELDELYDGILNLCINKQRSFEFMLRFAIAGNGHLSSTFPESITKFPPVAKVISYLREPVGHEKDSIYELYQCFIEHGVTANVHRH